MLRYGIAANAFTADSGCFRDFERLRSFGYDGVDYNLFMETEKAMFQIGLREFETLMKSRRAEIEQCGLAVHQTHGPWRYPPRDADVCDRAERMEKMTRALYGTALLGCENMVIHPLMPFGCAENPDPERSFALNVEFMTALTERAKENGVTVCYENMPMRALTLSTPLQLLEIVGIIDSPHFKMCLDTGHAQIMGVSPADAVRQIGADNLCALHIHDNDGTGDQHRTPYTAGIDFDAFGKALHEIGFNGVISLETGSPADSDEQRYAAAESARRLAKLAAGETV